MRGSYEGCGLELVMENLRSDEHR